MTSIPEQYNYDPALIAEFNKTVDSLFIREQKKSEQKLISNGLEGVKKPIQETDIPITPPIVQIGIVQDICDLRCRQCWLPKLIASGEAKPQIMRQDLFENIIQQVADIDSKYNTVTPIRFLGSGESLMDPHVVDKVVFAKSVIKGPIALITNGHRLLSTQSGQQNVIARDLLEAGLDIIDISIDAASDDVYQQLRGDDKHHYEDIVNTTMELINMRNDGNYQTTIMGSFLVQPENFHQADIFINTLGTVLDQYIFRKYHSYRGNIPSKPHNIPETKGPCAAPFGRLNITADGIVTGCYLDWKKEMPIGDLDKSRTSLIDLWQGPMREMQLKHLSGDFPDFCKDCDGYAAAHFGALSYDIVIRNATGKSGDRNF